MAAVVVAAGEGAGLEEAAAASALDAAAGDVASATIGAASSNRQDSASSNGSLRLCCVTLFVSVAEVCLQQTQVASRSGSIHLRTRQRRGTGRARVSRSAESVATMRRVRGHKRIECGGEWSGLRRSRTARRRMTNTTAQERCAAQRAAQQRTQDTKDTRDAQDGPAAALRLVCDGSRRLRRGHRPSVSAQKILSNTHHSKAGTTGQCGQGAGMIPAAHLFFCSVIVPR